MNPLTQKPQQAAKFRGGWLNTILNAANTIAIPVIGAHLQPGSGGGSCSPPSGCFTCQMKGRGAIAGCIDNLAVQLQQARSSGASPDQIIEFCTAAAQGLNSEALFTPQSDAYLADTKLFLQNVIRNEQARLVANPSLASTAQTAVSSGGVAAILGGGNNNLLLYGGAAVVVAILLAKRG